jgi:hypothetical protein
VEDFTIQSVLRGEPPLCFSLWQELVSPADLATLRPYAGAVYTATDAYLTELSSDGLRRVVDLSTLGLGWHTVPWVTRRFIVRELGLICAELAGGARG